MANSFDASLFHPSAIPAETTAVNQRLIDLMSGLPDWWIVGAETIRQARRRGEGPFPAAVKSPRAREIAITGHGGHSIALRVIAPDNPRGVYLHIHGGGWMLGSVDSYDTICRRLAVSAVLTSAWT